MSSSLAAIAGSGVSNGEGISRGWRSSRYRWKGELDGLLLANEGKSTRERLTLMRVFEQLRGPGYQGGYDAVRRYARGWQRERSASMVAAYVPEAVSGVSNE